MLSTKTKQVLVLMNAALPFSNVAANSAPFIPSSDSKGCRICPTDIFDMLQLETILPSPSVENCKAISGWAKSNRGTWKLSSNDKDKYQLLHSEGDCAVVAKISYGNTDGSELVTQVGNLDLAHLVDGLPLEQGGEGLPYEYKGGLVQCPNMFGIPAVDWWVRTTEGL